MLAELSLEGRTAVVTGAGRGIGKAISLVLAEAGADVVVAARTVSEIEDSAREVRAKGRRSLAVQVDVTDSTDVDALVERALAEFGTVDILVNNAGQLFRQPVVPLPDTSLAPPEVTREDQAPMQDDEWRSQMAVNLDSVMYGCRAIAPHMMSRGYGKIINISSRNSFQADPLMTAYSTSKAGINMLTRVLAMEWAPYNICVNAIAPGVFHTALNDHFWSDPVRRQAYVEAIPLADGGTCASWAFWPLTWRLPPPTT